MKLIVLVVILLLIEAQFGLARRGGRKGKGRGRSRGKGKGRDIMVQEMIGFADKMGPLDIKSKAERKAIRKAKGKGRKRGKGRRIKKNRPTQKGTHSTLRDPFADDDSMQSDQGLPPMEWNVDVTDVINYVPGQPIADPFIKLVLEQEAVELAVEKRRGRGKGAGGKPKKKGKKAGKGGLDAWIPQLYPDGRPPAKTKGRDRGSSPRSKRQVRAWPSRRQSCRGGRRCSDGAIGRQQRFNQGFQSAIETLIGGALRRPQHRRMSGPGRGISRRGRGRDWGRRPTRRGGGRFGTNTISGQGSTRGRRRFSGRDPQGHGVRMDQARRVRERLFRQQRERTRSGGAAVLGLADLGARLGPDTAPNRFVSDFGPSDQGVTFGQDSGGGSLARAMKQTAAVVQQMSGNQEAHLGPAPGEKQLAKELKNMAASMRHSKAQGMAPANVGVDMGIGSAIASKVVNDMQTALHQASGTILVGRDHPNAPIGVVSPSDYGQTQQRANIGADILGTDKHGLLLQSDPGAVFTKSVPDISKTQKVVNIGGDIHGPGQLGIPPGIDQSVVLEKPASDYSKSRQGVDIGALITGTDQGHIDISPGIDQGTHQLLGPAIIDVPSAIVDQGTPFVDKTIAIQQHMIDQGGVVDVSKQERRRQRKPAKLEPVDLLGIYPGIDSGIVDPNPIPDYSKTKKVVEVGRKISKVMDHPVGQELVGPFDVGLSTGLETLPDGTILDTSPLQQDILFAKGVGVGQLGTSMDSKASSLQKAMIQGTGPVGNKPVGDYGGVQDKGNAVAHLQQLMSGSAASSSAVDMGHGVGSDMSAQVVGKGQLGLPTGIDLLPVEPKSAPDYIADKLSVDTMGTVGSGVLDRYTGKDQGAHQKVRPAKHGLPSGVVDQGMPFVDKHLVDLEPVVDKGRVGGMSKQDRIRQRERKRKAGVKPKSVPDYISTRKRVDKMVGPAEIGVPSGVVDQGTSLVDKAQAIQHQMMLDQGGAVGVSKQVRRRQREGRRKAGVRRKRPSFKEMKQSAGSKLVRPAKLEPLDQLGIHPGIDSGIVGLKPAPDYSKSQKVLDVGGTVTKVMKQSMVKEMVGPSQLGLSTGLETFPDGSIVDTGLLHQDALLRKGVGVGSLGSSLSNKAANLHKSKIQGTGPGLGSDYVGKESAGDYGRVKDKSDAMGLLQQLMSGSAAANLGARLSQGVGPDTSAHISSGIDPLPVKPKSVPDYISTRQRVDQLVGPAEIGVPSGVVDQGTPLVDKAKAIQHQMLDQGGVVGVSKQERRRQRERRRKAGVRRKRPRFKEMKQSTGAKLVRPAKLEPVDQLGIHPEIDPGIIGPKPAPDYIKSQKVVDVGGTVTKVMKQSMGKEMVGPSHVGLPAGLETFPDGSIVDTGLLHQDVLLGKGVGVGSLGSSLSSKAASLHKSKIQGTGPGLGSDYVGKKPAPAGDHGRVKDKSDAVGLLQQLMSGSAAANLGASISQGVDLDTSAHIPSVIDRVPVNPKSVPDYISPRKRVDKLVGPAEIGVPSGVVDQGTSLIDKAKAIQHQMLDQGGVVGVSKQERRRQREGRRKEGVRRKRPRFKEMKQSTNAKLDIQPGIDSGNVGSRPALDYIKTKKVVDVGGTVTNVMKQSMGKEMVGPSHVGLPAGLETFPDGSLVDTGLLHQDALLGKGVGDGSRGSSLSSKAANLHNSKIQGTGPGLGSDYVGKKPAGDYGRVKDKSDAVGLLQQLMSGSAAANRGASISQGFGLDTSGHISSGIDPVPVKPKSVPDYISTRKRVDQLIGPDEIGLPSGVVDKGTPLIDKALAVQQQMLDQGGVFGVSKQERRRQREHRRKAGGRRKRPRLREMKTATGAKVFGPAKLDHIGVSDLGPSAKDGGNVVPMSLSDYSQTMEGDKMGGKIVGTNKLGVQAGINQELVGPKTLSDYSKTKKVVDIGGGITEVVTHSGGAEMVGPDLGVNIGLKKLSDGSVIESGPLDHGALLGPSLGTGLLGTTLGSKAARLHKSKVKGTGHGLASDYVEKKPVGNYGRVKDKSDAVGLLQQLMSGSAVSNPGASLIHGVGPETSALGHLSKLDHTGSIHPFGKEGQQHVGVAPIVDQGVGTGVHVSKIGGGKLLRAMKKSTGAKMVKPAKLGMSSGVLDPGMAIVDTHAVDQMPVVGQGDVTGLSSRARRQRRRQNRRKARREKQSRLRNMAKSTGARMVRPAKLRPAEIVSSQGKPIAGKLPFIPNRKRAAGLGIVLPGAAIANVNTGGLSRKARRRKTRKEKQMLRAMKKSSGARRVVPAKLEPVGAVEQGSPEPEPEPIVGQGMIGPEPLVAQGPGGGLTRRERRKMLRKMKQSSGAKFVRPAKLGVPTDVATGLPGDPEPEPDLTLSPGAVQIGGMTIDLGGPAIDSVDFSVKKK